MKSQIPDCVSGFGELPRSAALLLLVGLLLGLASSASALSPPGVVENVGVISVHIDIRGDLPGRDLLDETSIQNELVAHLAEGLAEDRPDIEVTGRRVAIEPIVLWVMVDISLRTDPPGAEHLPCCLGAVTVALARNDASGRRIPMHDVVSNEPFFVEPDPDEANERAVEVLEAELAWVLDWLTTLSPPYVRPTREAD